MSVVTSFVNDYSFLNWQTGVILKKMTILKLSYHYLLTQNKYEERYKSIYREKEKKAVIKLKLTTSRPTN